MIPNNLKLIYRNFEKDKLYSFIKIGGFALGIAACFLIALFIKYEVSYDKHYKNTDRLFRVVQVYNNDNDVVRSTVLQEPLAQTMMDEFPEIEKMGRIVNTHIFGAGSNQVRNSSEKTNYYETGFTYADQGLLEIMEFPVISGNPKNALTTRNNIIITREMAEKFFPNEEAVGKTLIINNDENNPRTITAVIENFPDNSHMKFNFLMAIYPNMFGQLNCWNCNNYQNYMLVKPGTNVALLEKKLKTIIDKYIIPYGVARREQFSDQTKDYYELQPVKDIHLKSGNIFYNSSFNYSDLGDGRVVLILGITAFFILLIACINFINLSTAKYSQRAKEIGLKKTAGANRAGLIRQFLTESFLYSFLSILLAIGITILFLPALNHLSGKILTVPWNEWWVIPVLLSATIIIGLLAGIYPSLFLSSLKPISTLKGKVNYGGKNSNLRNILVVFQFAASIILIICTLVIFKQMKFILNKDLGFNKEQVIILHGTNTLGDNILNFKKELESQANIQSVTISAYLPIENTQRNGNGFWTTAAG